MTLNRDDISNRLAAVGYIADHDVATALWLMDFLKRPLLLEGEAGVGKTEVAKALAAVNGAELIRLQCYEGLDQNAALYEWNYQRQLLAIKTRENAGANADAIEEHIFSERYLLERPLLAAIRREKPPVLLGRRTFLHNQARLGFVEENAYLRSHGIRLTVLAYSNISDMPGDGKFRQSLMLSHS